MRARPIGVEGVDTSTDALAFLCRERGSLCADARGVLGSAPVPAKTNSGGTFSPNVRITFAILRLRTSPWEGKTGVSGDSGTSCECVKNVVFGVDVWDEDEDEVEVV